MAKQGTTRALSPGWSAPPSTQLLMRLDHQLQVSRHAIERAVLFRFGLSWRGGIVLTNAAKPGGVDNELLAKASGVTLATLTGLTDTLTDAGLITRAPNPANRRRKTITLTRLGQRRLAALHDTIEPVAATLVPHFADLLIDIVNAEDSDRID